MLAYKGIDADNHYYEPIDAFTRYLDPAFKRRGIRPVQNGKRTELLAGGQLLEFIPNPTFDPVIVPGCLDLQFRGKIPEGTDPRTLMKVEPLSPAYQDKEARLAVMDKQGLESILLFPTLGCGVEEALAHDIPATVASLRAFNRWLEEDWGFGADGRVIAAPMISLADPAAAAADVDDLASRGARMIHIRPAPVPGERNTKRSLGDPSHDIVWERLEAHGIPVGFHLGDSGYNRIASAWGGPERFIPFREPDYLGSVIIADRAIHDTIASLIVHGVFTRFPELKVASIENGSDWVHLLLKRLNKQANGTPWIFPTPPIDIFRKSIWVAPYYEEDIRELADTITVDKVLFGSDWPHGEGLADPMSFIDELQGFTPEETEKIVRGNAATLLGLN